MEKIQEILNKGWNSYNKNHKVIGYKKKLPAIELLKQTLGKDFNLCPSCKKGQLV